MHIQKVNIEVFHHLLRSQNVPREHWAFKCPNCNTIQSANDLIAAGAGQSFEEVEKFLGFSCVGRFENAKHIGCNWTLGGLFKIHKLEIVKEGIAYPQFEVATPMEAQCHMNKHELFTSEDPLTPQSIKDRNCEVVLAMCKICGAAESELTMPCTVPALAME